MNASIARPPRPANSRPRRRGAPPVRAAGNAPASKADAELVKKALAAFGEDAMVADLFRYLVAEADETTPSSWKVRLYSALKVGKGRKLPSDLVVRLQRVLERASAPGP